MKNSLLVNVILTLLLLTNCSKKPEVPSPQTKTPVSNISEMSSSNGSKMTLSTIQETSGNVYSIKGIVDTGFFQSMAAIFQNGKPTSNFTQDLSKSNDITLEYATSTTSQIAFSGTVNVIVDDTSITVSFINILFKDNVSGDTTKYSGQLCVNTNYNGVFPHGIISIDQTTYTGYLTVTTSNTNGYTIIGSYLNNMRLNFTFSTKPTISSNEDLSSSSSKIALSFEKDSVTYFATSGAVAITVDNTNITPSFTNLKFITPNSSDTLVISAFATALK